MKSNQTLKIRDRKFSLKTLVASVIIATITSTLLTSIYFVTFVHVDVFPSTVTYTIETDGAGNYRAIRYDGNKFWESTNASFTINSAISSGNHVFLKEGTFELTNYISLKHGLIFEGTGENTIIKQADGANLDRVIRASLKTAISFGRYQIKNLVIDGNKANQNAGNGYGIESDTYSSVEGDYVTFENLIIQDTYGIGIETSGNYHFFSNVHVRNVDSHGFILKDYKASLIGCSSVRNGGHGFQLRGTGIHRLISCVGDGNGLSGIHVYGIKYADLRVEISGGTYNSNGQHGILFEAASNNRVSGVLLEGNSNAVANSNDNIHFKSYGTKHSKNNIVEGNTLKSRGKVRYQIYEADSNQDYNLVQGNEILDNGQTGKIQMQGSNSKVKNNIGFVTENSGTATIANNEYIAHGLEPSLNIGSTNSTVMVTSYTTVYDGVPVVVGSNYVNKTHIRINAYWTNNTAIADDTIQIWWSVTYP